MPLYTVHVRQSAADFSGDDKVVFTPEAFSRSAFFFGPFWFVWSRAWLGLALWLAAFVALAGATIWLGMPPGAALVLAFIIALLTGLEANSLRRRALEWRGYRLADVVSGERIEDAERAFFRRASTPPMPLERRPSPAAGTTRGFDPVGGLFFDGGG
jgi:hypothetical protein